MRKRILLTVAVVVSVFAGQAAAQQIGAGVGVGASLDVETIAPKKIKFPPGPPFAVADVATAGGIELFVYSAKFLCFGIDIPAGGGAIPLMPGFYLTAVNIHNPHPFPVRFTKKAVVTKPQGQPRGKVGQHVVEQLGPNEGVEVDCSNILQLLLPLPTPIGFLKGFVVLHSPAELDVTAVYTYKNVEVFPAGIAVTPPPGFGGR